MTTPRWLRPRLASSYFWYFSIIGVLAPYWSLYLADRGLEPQQIGLMFALLHGAKLLAPMVTGWWADHLGRPLTVVHASTVLATLAMGSLVALPGEMGWLVLCMALFGIGLNGALPLMEVNTLAHLGKRQVGYGPIRLWGSVGFILAAYGVGHWVAHSGIRVVPLALLAVSGVLCISTWLLPMAPVTTDETPSLGGKLREPRVLALLASGLLMQLSHGVYYTFYSIHLEALGYPEQTIGLLWGSAVVAEVLLFALMPRLRALLSVRTLLLWTFALTVLRWSLLGLGVEGFMGLLLIQCLHAFSFGSHHALAMALVTRFFPGRLAARGQALYSSFGFGLGSLLASLGVGYVWVALGAAGSFWLSAGVAALAGVVAWRWLVGEAEEAD